LHQFTHIIGFIRSILGDKVKPTTIKRINKMEKEKIIGDNLIKFARKYFNCNIIDCLEIEEFTGGDQFREFIHWDSRKL
jgi:hypothetical protein